MGWSEKTIMGYYKNKQIDIMNKEDNTTTIQIHKDTHKELKILSAETGVSIYELANVILIDNIRKMRID